MEASKSGPGQEQTSELLEGTTYQGHFLVADIAMQAPVPRGQTSFFCGPHGLMLLAPLPGERWVTFQDLEETVQAVSAEDVVRTEARIGGRSRPTDVAWASPFPRIASGDSYGNPLDDVDPVATLIPCLFAVERLCFA